MGTQSLCRKERQRPAELHINEDHNRPTFISLEKEGRTIKRIDLARKRRSKGDRLDDVAHIHNSGIICELHQQNLNMYTNLQAAISSTANLLIISQ